MRSTAACRSSTSTAPSGATLALPVAKFTSALATPGCRPSTRWTRTAQEPQVMPSTSKSSWSVPDGAAGSRAVSVISTSRLSTLPDWLLSGGNLVALLLDRFDQLATADRRLVVAHRYRPGRDVNDGAFDAADGGQGSLDRRLAVVTVDLGNRDRFRHHHAGSFHMSEALQALASYPLGVSA